MPPVPAEPRADAGTPLALRCLQAVRLPFLSVTLFAYLIGLGTAVRDGHALSGAALAGLLLALLCHAAVNVINDWADARNGTDAANTERIYPFTGGSRVIQNGVLGERAMLRYALALFGLTIAGGLLLLGRGGTDLLWIGGLGVGLGWGYSAQPLALNARGLGEPAVALGFALVAAGADCVVRGGFVWSALLAGSGYALAVTAILYVNQFPDRRADALAGKQHWVVRLGPARAAALFPALIAAAYALQGLALASGALPWPALAVFALAPLWRQVARELAAHAETPSQLAPAIRTTILAANLYGALTAAALWIGALGAS